MSPIVSKILYFPCMRRTFLFFFVLLLLVGWWWLSRDFDRIKSTLYVNADVLTLASEERNIDAVFVEKGIIKAVGSVADLEKYKDQAEVIIDLNLSLIHI